MLLLAIAYSNFTFAYLYRVSYTNDFTWPDSASSLNAIWYSISNSLAANYDEVKPLTSFGNSIAMIQLIITFIFVTIILSKSVPQKN
ncbi:MAG: hypothetical protein Q8M15_17025 [Bacteroidota bacterium]|nr:hypothetical protein [Bacteroidota bacterium]